MTTPEQQTELINKIQKALDTVYAKVVEFKKQKGTDIVIMQDNKIIRIKPEKKILNIRARQSVFIRVQKTKNPDAQSHRDFQFIKAQV